MITEAKLPIWLNPGIEPPESLRTTGWQKAMKPAPEYFNWFFNRTYLALKELQENGNVSELEQLINTLQQIVDNHLVDPMPHQFKNEKDSNLKYKWGFGVDSIGPHFTVEKVV